LSKSGMNEREEARLLALVKSTGGIQEGDKCPMDGCRGILQNETRVLFNPNVENPMFGFEVLECDRKRCKFTGFVTKQESARIKEWREQQEVPA